MLNKTPYKKYYVQGEKIGTMRYRAKEKRRSRDKERNGKTKKIMRNTISRGLQRVTKRRQERELERERYKERDREKRAYRKGQIE